MLDHGEVCLGDSLGCLWSLGLMQRMYEGSLDMRMVISSARLVLN